MLCTIGEFIIASICAGSCIIEFIIGFEPPNGLGIVFGLPAMEPPGAVWEDAAVNAELLLVEVGVRLDVGADGADGAGAEDGALPLTRNRVDSGTMP